MKQKERGQKGGEWDLSPLLKSDTDPAIAKEQQLIKKDVEAFASKWRGRKDYLENVQALRTALDEYEALHKKRGISGAAGLYFSLRSTQDQSNTTVKAGVQKTTDFSVMMSNQLHFFGLALSKIPVAQQQVFLKEPLLGEYNHYLSRVFLTGKYNLEEAEEKILSLMSETSYSKWVNMVEEFISKETRVILQEDGSEKEKSFEEIASLMDSQNKKVRDLAALAFNEILDKHKASAEAEINAILAYKKVEDDLRKTERADTLRHVADDIESTVVDTMIATVQSHNDLAQAYYAFKAKLMGLKKLAYHERNIPYGIAEKEYSFEETLALVKKVFARLDPEFESIVTRFAENGQYDVYPHKGKRGGAYCTAIWPGYPTYIMLNHTNRLQDVKTFAHESGHGINHELIKAHNNSLNAESPLSTAEVASTFMEDFVLDELGKEADEELRLALIMKKLNDDVSTIFRQVACYCFEQELHATFRKKGFVPLDEIGTIFLKHMKSYMGPTIEQSPGSQNWWVYWSHIREFFYVYSYSSGLLISKALQRMVRADKANVAKVKQFLSAGMSDSPQNTFLKIGIDIRKKAFWETGLAETADLLKQAQTLAKKLKKI